MSSKSFDIKLHSSFFKGVFKYFSFRHSYIAFDVSDIMTQTVDFLTLYSKPNDCWALPVARKHNVIIKH